MGETEWECIMSDPETGETTVVYTLATYFEDAVYAFEASTEPGELWDGFIPFVPSTLAV